MLKIALVGCGKVADQHVEQLRHIPGCKIVGVCDREELMARQLQERLGLPAYTTEVQALLEHTTPDVVHITTPPQSHYPVGKVCLEAGCHVYIEKPFTVTAAEAEDLIALARRMHRHLTVGNNYQFSHAALRMRRLVERGYLGGPPVHIESYYCYDLSDASYARAVLGDRHHWVRKLPGGLLQNIISHGISKIVEFLQSDAPEILAYGFTSPQLRSFGETEIVDELRVIIHDGAATAYFTFSSQMRPLLHQLRLYGPKNGLIMDVDQQTMIKVKGTPYKSYLEQFVPPWVYARQYVAESLGNIRKFLNGNFHTGHGMKVLMQAFYQAITQGTPPPVPYEDILLTARIMDEIFSQLCLARNTRVLCHSGTRIVGQP